MTGKSSIIGDAYPVDKTGQARYGFQCFFDTVIGLLLIDVEHLFAKWITFYEFDIHKIKRYSVFSNNDNFDMCNQLLP